MALMNEVATSIPEGYGWAAVAVAIIAALTPFFSKVVDHMSKQAASRHENEAAILARLDEELKAKAKKYEEILPKYQEVLGEAKFATGMMARIQRAQDECLDREKEKDAILTQQSSEIMDLKIKVAVIEQHIGNGNHA